MIFSIPINYSVSGRKEKLARTSRSALWETLGVEVAEAAADDAPVVLEWNDRDLQRDWEGNPWGPVADDGMQHVRWFNDLHYAPVLAPSLGRRLREPARITTNQFQEYISSGFLDRPFQVPMRGTCIRTVSSPFEGYAEVEWSDRDERCRELQSAFDALLVVDGKLYRRCDAPVVVARVDIVNFGAGAFQGCTLRVVADHRQALSGSDRVFGGMRFREALAYANRFNMHSPRKDELKRANECRRPAVLADYQVSGPDGDIPVLSTYLHALIAHFERIPLHELDTHTVRHYADVRDGLERLDTAEGRSMVEDACAKLLARHGRPTHGIMTNTLAMARLVIETAEAMPIGEEIAHAGRNAPSCGI